MQVLKNKMHLMTHWFFFVLFNVFIFLTDGFGALNGPVEVRHFQGNGSARVERL